MPVPGISSSGHPVIADPRWATPCLIGLPADIGSSAFADDHGNNFIGTAFGIGPGPPGAAVVQRAVEMLK